MKSINFSSKRFWFICLLLLSSIFVGVKQVGAKEANELKQHVRYLQDSSLLLAQTGVSDLDRTLPNLSNPEQVIENSEQIQENFNYEDIDYWKNLCDLFGRTGQVARTREACSRLIELNDDKDADTWLARGISLFESGNYTEAVASFDETIDLSENYSLAFTQRCASYFQLALYEDALTDCASALDIDGDWKDKSPAYAWYYQGLTFSRLGRLEAALINFERAISHTPEFDLARAERCRVLLDLKLKGEKIRPCSEDQAASHYATILAEEPNNIIAWTNQGLYFEASNRQLRARSSYSQAMEILPESSFILARYCQVNNKLGMFEKALDSCISALEGDRIFGSENLSMVWSQQSKALVGLGRYEEALSSADKAVALDAGISEGWNNKGVSLWYLGKNKKALIALQKAINIDPGYSSGLFNYGRVLSSLGKYEEALELYNRALKARLGDMPKVELSDIWVNKSFVLFNLDLCKQAFDSANKSVYINSKSFQGWYNRGIAAVCLGKHEVALDAYTKADKIKPENIDVFTAKAIAFEKLGFYQKALESIEKALDLESEYTPALKFRERLLRVINRDN